MSSSPPQTLRDRFAVLSPRTQRLVVAAALAAAFLSTLDGTVVSTATPRILEQLEGDASLFTWIVTAYLLTSTVTIPLYGRYSDVYGRKPALLVGLGIFLAGSALCGVAGSMSELIVYRGLQGLGAGALLSVGMVLIRDVFTLDRMANLQAIMGTMLAVTLIGGPYLGGLITGQLGWRWIFYLNVLVSIPVIAVIALLLPGHRDPDAPNGRPDLLGVALLMSSVSLLLFGLTEKGRSAGDPQRLGGLEVHGWTSLTVLGSLVASALLLVAFVVVEGRATVPLVPLWLFRDRSYSAILVTGFTFSMATFPVVLFLTLYFQDVRGFSPSDSGLLLLPLLICLVTSNWVCASLVARSHRARGVLVAGGVLLGAGSALFAGLGAGTSLLTAGIGMALVGIGMGPSMAAIGMVAQNAVPLPDMGSATSGVVLTKQIGQSFGLAVGQTLFAQLLASGAGGDAGTSAAVGQAIAAVGVTGSVLALLAVAVMGNVAVFDPHTRREAAVEGKARTASSPG